MNDKVIYDVLRDDEISRLKIEQRGEVRGILKEIALSQLDDTIAEIIYKEQRVFESPGPPPRRELYGKSFSESATILFDRISVAQQQIGNLEGPKWRSDFESYCQEKRKELLPKWEADWVSLCDGKRFFRDLHSRYGRKCGSWSA
jgi:hypothetical protein